MKETSVHAERSSDKTAPPIPANAGDAEKTLASILSRVPPILRLPPAKKGARCPYTNESRGSLMEIVTPCRRNNFSPPVKAIYKKAHEHARRGQWLIPAEPLFRYLLGLAATSTETYLETVKERANAKEAV